MVQIQHNKVIVKFIGLTRGRPVGGRETDEDIGGWRKRIGCKYQRLEVCGWKFMVGGRKLWKTEAKREDRENRRRG